MKQRKISVLLASIFCFFLASCTGDFLDLNTNKHSASEKELTYDNMAVGALITQMQHQIFPCVAKAQNVDVNNYQHMYSLAGDIFSGHQGTSNAFDNNSNTTYNLLDKWIGTAFRVAYQNSMSPWYTLAQKQEANPTTFAVGQILRVLMMHRITDMYGPLPYEGFVPSTNIPYTGQDQIYYSFFEDLDEAVLTLKTFLEGNPGAKPLAKFDKIYGGDFEKWIKFANSLKLRLAMRIVYAEPEIAERFAVEAVSDGVFTSNDDNAMLAVDGASTLNPLSMISDAYDDTRLGATMESYLKGYEDPRLGLWFHEAQFNKKEYPAVNGYYGIRLGSTFQEREYKVFSRLKIAPNTPIQIMTAAEVNFLMAEAALRGWSMGGSDREFYNKGIMAAFGQNIGAANAPAGDYTDYIKSTKKPTDYIDPMNNNNSSKALGKISVAWDTSAGFEIKLERIITQKWIALFPDGQEAWSEFRRTGYPKVFTIRKNTSGGAIDSYKQIRRLRFPREEYTSNPEGLAVGIEKLGGDDTGATKLWWDKK